MNTKISGASAQNPSFIIDVSSGTPALNPPHGLDTTHGLNRGLLEKAFVRAATRGVAGYREAGEGPLVVVKKSEAPDQFVVDILHEPTVAQLPPAALLQDLFGLTATESEVARSIAQGENAKEIAERFGISRNTARVHVQRVLTKTGCHRQSQLGSMLHGLTSVVARG